MTKATLPLKAFAEEAQTGPFGSQLHSEEYIEDGVPVINPSNIKDGRLVADRFSTVSEETSHRLRVHRLRAGDLVFARRGELGRAAVVSGREEGWLCGTGSIRVRVNHDQLDPHFAGYALQSAEIRSYFEQRAVGSTMGNLNTTIVLGAPIRNAPLEEQRRIADFLDVEVGKIDDLISKKLRLISLMEERINSRILEQVGASQLVRYSTGTPVLPIRRILIKVIRPAVKNEGIVTAFRDGQVTERGQRRAEGYTLSASTEAQGQYVQAGDVVVHGLDGFAGAIGTSESNGNCSPVYHVCVLSGDGDAHFMGRFLRLLAIQGYLGNFATSTRERAVDFRNWDLFGRIPVPVVPAPEQREIGAWIIKLRPLRNAVERSKALAAERRQALITAAVTGQFDVTTASGRNVTGGVPR
ncbi:restriction endonuclease subunit S [Streptomyces sp. NBC_01537]|uniref:restriction endonuclease subunit S n=1 Tax=Streptomyces sp. NBC_01537 TaxID=2903896 RepID=UPI00386810F3